MNTERLTPEEYLQKLEADMRQNQVSEEKPDVTPEVKKNKKKKKRRKKHYFLRFVVFVGVCVGIFFLLRSSLFYVTDIQVTGNRFYTPSQVIEMSGLTTGKNIIFETKTNPARDALLETPYIRVAKIKRKFPSTLIIELDERIEYAAIAYENGYALIDNEGMVLSISDKLPELPLLEGMNLVEVTPGKPLEIEQAYLLTDTLDLLNAVDETDIYFYKVYFSSVKVRAYINENYYCEGAPSDIKDNLDALKQLMETHFNQDINKGVIIVGSGGYLSFNPKIDK